MLGALTALAWHRTGPLRYERPVTTEIVRFGLPGAHMWIMLAQPTTFMLLTFALAAAAAMSGRTVVGIAGTAGCLSAVAVNERILKPFIGRYRLIHLPARLTHAMPLGAPTYLAVAKVRM